MQRIFGIHRIRDDFILPAFTLLVFYISALTRLDLAKALDIYYYPLAEANGNDADRIDLMQQDKTLQSASSETISVFFVP